MQKPNQNRRRDSASPLPGSKTWEGPISCLKPFGAAFFLLLITVLAYLPAIGNGYIWDDADYVTENLTLRDLAGLARMWLVPTSIPQYYPLVHTTFWVEYHLWGLNPVGYHLVNVLLHGLAAILLWRVLLQIQKLSNAAPNTQYATFNWPWLAAAIWALHPVNVESVAWITERKNVLSAVFYFGAALAYLRFTQQPEIRNPKSEFKWKWYLAALGLFVCALLSKTVTCSLPAALLLVAWWQRGRIGWRDALPLLPFFVAGIALGLHTAWLEKHHVGAIGAYWNQTLAERFLIAGRALWFYAAKLVWPSPLMMIYPRWEINASVWWQWLFPISALVVVAALFFLRKLIGRGPVTAALFFAGTLFPALGFFNVYPMRFSFVADHFQYLAASGLIAAGTAGLARLLGRYRAVVLVLLLPLGVLTWKHTHVFRDVETLWRDTLAKNPNCALAHNNLGALLAERGEVQKAEWHYREALRLEPDGEETLSNLAVVFAERGEIESAMALLNRAIQISPANAEIRANLGKVLAGRGQTAEAIAAFEMAIRLKPQRAEFYYNLGTVLAGQGRVDAAIERYRQALERRPDYADAHNNLGLMLAGKARYDEAMHHYNEALRIKPNHALAHNNLGHLLLTLGQIDPAINHLNEALRIKPDYANAHFNLGNALALKKRYEEAVAQFTEALRIMPNHAPAHRSMGMALARLGRRQEAEHHLREALRINPGYTAAREQLRALGFEPAGGPSAEPPETEGAERKGTD